MSLVILDTKLLLPEIRKSLAAVFVHLPIPSGYQFIWDVVAFWTSDIESFIVRVDFGDGLHCQAVIPLCKLIDDTYACIAEQTEKLALYTAKFVEEEIDQGDLLSVLSIKFNHLTLKSDLTPPNLTPPLDNPLVFIGNQIMVPESLIDEFV